MSARKIKSKSVIITLRYEVDDPESFEWVIYKNSVNLREQQGMDFFTAMNSLVVTLSTPENDYLFGYIPKALLYPVTQIEAST